MILAAKQGFSVGNWFSLRPFRLKFQTIYQIWLPTKQHVQGHRNESQIKKQSWIPILASPFFMLSVWQRVGVVYPNQKITCFQDAFKVWNEKSTFSLGCTRCHEFSRTVAFVLSADHNTQQDVWNLIEILFLTGRQENHRGKKACGFWVILMPFGKFCSSLRVLCLPWQPKKVHLVFQTRFSSRKARQLRTEDSTALWPVLN